MAIAFVAYLSLAIILVVIFIVIVSELEPALVRPNAPLVEAMLATFKAYAWKLRDRFLIECQVDTAELGPMTGQPTRKSMGFARYRPETKTTTWLDYD